MRKKGLVLLLVNVLFFHVCLGSSLLQKITSFFLGNNEDQAPHTVTTEVITLPEIPRIHSDKTSLKTYQTNPNNEKTVKVDDKKLMSSHYRYIEKLYLVLLLRKAEESEYQNWLSNLSQGGSREGVYRALIFGPEHYQLENLKEKINPAGKIFVSNFLKKYLGDTIDTKILEEANIFQIKKLLIEKSLELIDYWVDSPELAARWYAVFSQEVHNYFLSDDSEMRKSDNLFNHKKWFLNTPRDISKSEVIVKLSIVLNTFRAL